MMIKKPYTFIIMKNQIIRILMAWWPLPVYSFIILLTLYLFVRWTTKAKLARAQYLHKRDIEIKKEYAQCLKLRRKQIVRRHSLGRYKIKKYIKLQVTTIQQEFTRTHTFAAELSIKIANLKFNVPPFEIKKQVIHLLNQIAEYKTGKNKVVLEKVTEVESFLKKKLEES